MLTKEMIIAAVIAGIVLLIVIILTTGYIKAAPDMAIIISGMGKNSRLLIGKAGVKIPFFERKDELKLSLVQVDVKTSSSVPTADYINITVDANVNVKISDDKDRIRLAAQNFLNRDTKYIAQIAREVLEGNMREIIGKMRLEDMVSDRQKFAELVRENAVPDLAGMGLDIISFNVQNFTDGNGVIDNLGVDNVVRIQKDAAISRAEAERDTAVAKAKATEESNRAEVEAQTTIASRQNELEIKKSELKREADKNRAIADAAYSIQEQEQRKAIETATVDANIAKQEREIELRKAEALAAEETLNATVKKKADADLYQRQKAAEAVLIERQHEAEAVKYEKQQEAEALKISAEAAKYAKEQEAQGIRALGIADAEATKARGMAEAEAMDKKAEAMKKYGQAAITEMIVDVLPKMAESIATSIGNIDKLTVIDSGSGNAVQSVGNYTPAVLAKTIEAVKEATGFDLTESMKAGTYDAAVNRNLTVDGLPTEVKAVSVPKTEYPIACREGCENHECTSGHKCHYAEDSFDGSMNEPK